MPINEWRVAGREISVKPKSRAHELHGPTDDKSPVHTLARFLYWRTEARLLAEKYFLPRLVRQFHSSLHPTPGYFA